MQNAETVLGVLRERGRKGLPLTELYRQLFNPQLYLMAYGRIYANHGAMTAGVTQETVDGMSLGKIGRIIDAMRHERYRFSPARRVYIPKKNGKLRPLGMPTWSDKLVGEVVRLLLESYYEPSFSDRSHGFRPRRGCHTALREVANTWPGTAWFIEGDISDCFGSLDHQVMLDTLAGKIHDNRFLRLLRNMLQAGYLEDWTWNATLSGAPQGGVASPILSNIYLHRLDRYVETVLIPHYTRGERRARNPAYLQVANELAKARRRGDRTQARALRKVMLALPSSDPNDPGYRRLRYIRYADDHLLGFAGPKAEAEEIKQQLTQFLRDDLKLELNHAKTLITHARTGMAKFLGYEITVQHNDRKLTRGRRNTNGQVALRVPRSVVQAKIARYLQRGQPARRTPIMNRDDYSIVATYGAEYRGIVQYYLLASNIRRLHRLRWVMLSSLLRTLASKHHSTPTRMARKHQAKIVTPNGPRVCFEATLHREGRKPLVARFGGIPLQRQKTAVIDDRQPDGLHQPRKELITRLLKRRCELCDQTGHMNAHHVRSLADLGPPGPAQPAWAAIMARRKRKALVVCDACHDHIHARQPDTLTA
ncbi:reverse transcriptase/maturase family protein [Micromonospora craniellae]|uniref:reverse transcriptase/maturase family protein n=1 Tax=Micromonospora craniellae TaxID=2294034 RepID=UPI00168B80E7|nr:reverse transcriptase/maturase family protein [Micromonospora craniellae]QOC92309.1 maturase [Micromonospora craniellae]